MDADRHHGRAQAGLKRCLNDSGCPRLERQMPMAEIAGALRHYEERAATAQVFNAAFNGDVVLGALVMAAVLVANDFDAVEDHPSDQAAPQLHRNHEYRLRQKRLVDTAVNRAVAMQPDIENGTGGRAILRVKESCPVVITVNQQAGEQAEVEVAHLAFLHPKQCARGQFASGVRARFSERETSCGSEGGDPGLLSRGGSRPHSIRRSVSGLAI